MIIKANHYILIFCLMAPISDCAAAGEAEKEVACKDDAMRLCSQHIPDREKIALCLRESMPKLSPACRSVFEDEKSKPR